MKGVKKVAVFWIAMLLMLTGGAYPASASEKENLQAAAFVRNGELWVTIGGAERLLASGPAVRNPKWSFDGAWIAYTKGEAEQELWMADTRTGESKLVSGEGGSSFHWAPNDNKLAYQTPQLLQYVDVREPNKPIESAKGIGNFAWLPDGMGFFASSRSELLADGTWTPITLYQIPLQRLADPGNYKTVHVLPKPSDEFFAVGTSTFKWSADGRWIAFLATPTASLSADINTLCVIRTDGVVFRTLDQMVNNEQWFEWGPSDAHLAYIEGVGREAGINKRLKVLNVNTGRGGTYTPEGYVDQNFAWQSPQQIIVSRAKEMKQGSGEGERELPFLAAVELVNGKQARLTKPNEKSGDYNPVSLKPKLAWVRHERAAAAANVMISRSDGKKAKVWIKSVDQASNYYGQWNWNEVLQFYRNGGEQH